MASQAAIQSVLPVCQTRAHLLDQLASAVEQLGRAKLSLSDLFENTAFIPGPFVAEEVEQLRTDCSLIRAELEYHRVSHGC
jgi:hypothetical protein